MKILIVHNAYQQRGGEDSVVDAEISMLRAYGHHVSLYRRDNGEIENSSRIKLFVDTLWSKKTSVEAGLILREFSPDIIHVHNTFPLISPSIYWTAAEAGIPVVQTLHNFRLHCPQAMFLRDDHVCEDCLGKTPWRGVVRGCYRNSRMQTAVLTSMLLVHRGLGTYTQKVSRYIALNDFCREKFIQGGLPENKVVVKPNFVDWKPVSENSSEADLDTQNAKTPQARSGFLFVGRLSVEKGVSVMADAVQLLDGNVSLRVAGTGQEVNCLDNLSAIELLGALDGGAVQWQMSQSLALLMPSIWYENFPRTLVEAFASGLPVIASRLGALPQLIDDGRTGLLFEPGNPVDLAEKIAWAHSNKEAMLEMGRNARLEYERKYTSEINYRQLIDIYEDAIATMPERRKAD